MSVPGVAATQDRHPKRWGLTRLRSNGWVAGVTLLLILVAVPGLFSPSYLLISLAACSLFVVVLPLWSCEQIDWFSTWSFVVYVVFVGVFLRAVFITFDIPDTFSISRTFLLGESKDFLLLPSLFMVGGLLSMTIGYLAAPDGVRTVKLQVLRSDRWHRGRLMIVIFGLLLVSGIAMGTLVMRTGGLSLANLSGKRFVARTIEEYSGRGYLRLAAGMSSLVVYLLTAKIASDRQARLLDLVLLGSGLALALFDAFYQSSRGGMAFHFIGMLAVWYYLRPRAIKFPVVLTVGIVSLFLIQVLTHLRSGLLFDQSMIQNSLDLLDAMKSVVVSRNFVDVSKTAHIIDAIPKTIGYQWGRTLVLWTVAWIPRSLWRGKPITSIGQLLGPTVFGSSTRIGGGGTPPGIIAELYWNFSLPGIILGCFAIGYLLRVVYVHFLSYSWNRNAVLLYVVSFMRLGMSLLGGDLTRTMVGLATSFLPLYAILDFITKPSEAPPGDG